MRKATINMGTTGGTTSNGIAAGFSKVLAIDFWVERHIAQFDE